jgi:hypothetical protein
MIDTIASILTHPAFTAIIGFLVGHYWAIRRDKRKEFIDASDEFRKIFTQALVEIRDEDAVFDVYSVEKDFFKKLKVAYSNFRHYLRGIRRRHYDYAWRKYYHDCKYHWDFNSDIREVVVKDIENLIEFTKYGFIKDIYLMWEDITFRFRPLDQEIKNAIEYISKHNKKF